MSISTNCYWGIQRVPSVIRGLITSSINAIREKTIPISDVNEVFPELKKRNHFSEIFWVFLRYSILQGKFLYCQNLGKKMSPR